MGGTDKGNDYTSLLPLAKEKVKAMICMGLDNKKFHESFEGIVPEIHDVTCASDAVKLAHKLSDVCLCVFRLYVKHLFAIFVS